MGVIREAFRSKPKKSLEGIKCIVHTSETGPDGTIYCGIRSEGVIVKEEKDQLWVKCDKNVRSYRRSSVEVVSGSN